MGPSGFVQDISSKVNRSFVVYIINGILNFTMVAWKLCLISLFFFTSFYMVRVIILDHHKTALEKLTHDCSIGQNVIKVIDIQRSGATIAFDYFKQKLLQDAVTNFNVDVGSSSHHKVLNEFERMRKLYEYIEDGDLWKWSLPNSKALSSGLKDLNIEFDALLNPNLFNQVISPVSLGVV